MIKLTPRYYQEEAVTAIMADLAQSIRALLGMATGTGKTFTLAYLLYQVMVKGKRALFVVHEEGLMYQAHKTFHDIMYPLGYTVGMVRGTKHKDYENSIVVAMVQSINPTRAKKMGQFDIVLIDEAHHYIDNTWMEAVLLFINDDTHVVGCTATHFRNDDKSMGIMFPDVAERDELTYYYSTTQGIRDGYLAKFDAYTIETELDISHMGRSNGYIGTEKQWNDLWEAGNWAELMYKEMVQKGFPQKLTIGFMPSVNISRKFAQWISEEHDIIMGHVDGDGAYIYESGEEKEVTRKILYDRFRSGYVKGMLNFAVTTEGFDAPEIEIVLMNRPTDSPVLLMQMLGRGLRISDLIPDKRATFLFAGFKDKQIRIVDYSGIAGAIPSDEVEAVEEALDILEAGGVAQENQICMHCNIGYLERIKGTEIFMCTHCKTMTVIPQGSEDDDEPLFDPSKLTGVGTKAKLIDLMHKQPVAWYKEGGVFSVGIGVGGTGQNQGQRTVMIFPPGHVPSQPDGWNIIVLFRKVKGFTIKGNRWHKYKKYSYESPVAKGYKPRETLSDALVAASNIIDAYQDPTGRLSNKKEKWRSDPASENQVNQCIGRFNLPKHKIVDENGKPRITKGDAGRIYAHHDALQFLRGNTKRKPIIN